VARGAGGVRLVTFTPSPEQRAVVAQPLASFRVDAGAGTGKTTTVALRVAALVTRHGVPPERILGITFTNKAAGELAERIASVLDGVLDSGREVEVHTYHGYASQILREFGALVGIERDTRLVTPTFARQMLSELVLSAPLQTWDLSNAYAIDRLTGLAAELSDNLLSPADVVVPDPCPDDAWLKRADGLAVLRMFESEKRRLGVADYGDLIASAHRLVSTYPDVSTSISERYSAVVLDEYQDTNPAQRELLRTIFGGRVPVMAVGDADQTIYEWRGASLENFRMFGVHFPNGPDPAPSLPLTTNRRSGDAILVVANEIRSVLDADSNHLVAAPGTDPGTVETAWLGTAAEEADWIADRIERLHDDGLRWADCAVLFRKNKDMLIVHEALSRRDIPYEVANLGGLLSVPEVTDLWCWLRLLAQPEDSTAVARLLTGSRFRLGLADLARLSDWVRSRRADVEDDIDGLPDFTLVEALDHLGDIDGLRPEAVTAAARFHAEHRRFLEAAQGLSLVELCRTILDSTAAWQDIDAMPGAAGLSAKLNLFRFLDLAESWSPLEGRPSLAAFVSYLSLIDENPREELDTARISQADAVTLITVHRAKGLEWEAVFLPAMYHRNFPSGYRGGDPETMPEVLPFELRLDRGSLPHLDAAMDRDARKDALRARHDASEWRLAYVASTRARRYLIASGAWWYGHPMPLAAPTNPSALFELIDRHATRVTDVPEPPDRPSRTAYRSPAAPPDPGLPDGWAGTLWHEMSDPGSARKAAVEAGIERAYDAAVEANQQHLFALPDPATPTVEVGVVTSATGLVTYATCPLRYKWTSVDPLPRRASAAARRGVEVHRRIELHNLGVVPLTEPTPWTEPTPDEGTPAASGIDPYDAFLQSRHASVAPVLTEVPFELHTTSGVVRGRIDAVYDWEDGREIVDFKSGRPRPDGPNLVQLQTYALALEEIDFGLAPPPDTSVSFVYLGGGEPVQVTHHVDSEWLEDARQTVIALLGSMEDERWEPAPSPECHRCDFLRFCPAGQAFVS